MDYIQQSYRIFCKLYFVEITIQKIWRLLIENITEKNLKVQRSRKIVKDKKMVALDVYDAIGAGFVKTLDEAAKYGKKKIKAKKINADEIKKLDIGYSCTMDKIEDDEYYEVFKYAFKISDDERQFMTYENFKVLYKALHKRKVFQSYGEWYNVAGDDEIDDSLAYEFIHEFLNNFDSVEKRLTIDEAKDLQKAGEYKLITRRRIQKYLEDDHPDAELDNIMIAGVALKDYKVARDNDRKLQNQLRREARIKLNSNAKPKIKKPKKITAYKPNENLSF